MEIYHSNRLKALGSSIFAEVNTWKLEVKAKGVNLIDLGIGSPDRPPSERVIQSLKRAVSNPNYYGYPTSEGLFAFREKVSEWYKYRFDVELDPEHEILTLMGSQDGLAHLALAITDPGDVAMVPDPGYPIYSASLALAGVKPYKFPLREENDYLPKLEDIPLEILHKAKFMLLNYPSNPLSAVAEHGFFEHLISFAKKYNLLIVHDLAYSEMAFDGYRPISILEVSGAKEICVEFHSMSKSFNMAGCRIGFMVGNASVIEVLRKLKSNIDYGVFHAIQEAAITALDEDMEGLTKGSEIYEKRRNVVIDGLAEAGWNIKKPKATMFVWAKIPAGWTSRQISREMLYATGVVVIPGDAFGSEGEGYVRIALVHEEEILKDAVFKISRFLKGEHHVKYI